MEYKWNYLSTDPEKVTLLSRELNISELVASILLHRKIDSYDKARRFFNPEFSQIYDPFLMKDMAKSVDRIVSALMKNESILIFGDYDVDGITATSILYLFLKELGAKVYYYLPDRDKEGYGLSRPGIDFAISNGVSLLISCDCGIGAFEEIRYAAKHGLDVIVTDHHEPGKLLPESYAVLNPKQKNCQYPFKELSGVGVSFKLIQALSGTLNMGTEPFKRYLDLVTIGTSADIVPLVDENRVMVSEGLRRIELTDNLGIQALMETSGIRNTEINVERIIFILAPRINAVGRLGDASKAVELLTTGDVTRAYSIARILEAENRKRRNLDVKTFKQAESELLRIYDKSKWRSAVLASESWHHGVIGIAAAKLVEKYFLPTILISIKDGIGRGSARSIPGFDIYRALQSCEGLLLNFGGHKYAAGLRIDPEAIPEFRHKFNELAFEIISEDLMTPTINIEAEISLNEINSTLLSLNRKLAPFGPSNTKPVFASRELQVVGNPHIVGDSHMKFKVRQNQIVHDVIGFDMAERLSGISKGTYIDMAYVIDENVWQGVKRVQLNTKDIKFN